ncbi:CsbD family protein [Frondihabitans sp. 4ASC-45]|uniref:CsbD family protein n=1 Tax=Frondihabitans sp. 4ASC-45 TaxID=3111636 RepID=UPI003C285D6C
MALGDKIQNAAQDIAGKAKEVIGDKTDNENLEAEGHKDQASASVKKTGEDVKDVFKS